MEREVRVLKLLRHGNIVSLLDSFKYRGRTCIVMEYVQQTVLECLKVHPHGLGTRLTKQVTWQLVKALEYMHTQKVLLPANSSALSASWQPSIPLAGALPCCCK